MSIVRSSVDASDWLGVARGSESSKSLEARREGAPMPRRLFLRSISAKSNGPRLSFQMLEWRASLCFHPIKRVWSAVQLCFEEGTTCHRFSRAFEFLGDTQQIAPLRQQQSLGRACVACRETPKTDGLGRPIRRLTFLPAASPRGRPGDPCRICDQAETRPRQPSQHRSCFAYSLTLVASPGVSNDFGHLWRQFAQHFLQIVRTR